ncbi:MAG: FixH family protein [Crocinitomicaceae bacterium]|jgi:hypothetical protein
MNWGKGLTIAIIAFMSFILYMVITLMTKGNADLVSEDYYKKEIEYEKEITALKNSENSTEKVTINNKGEFIVFQFPTTKEIDNIEIHLLRPNNDKADLTFSEKDTKNVMIEKKKLEKGVYKASIRYDSEGQPFLQKAELNIN